MGTTHIRAKVELIDCREAKRKTDITKITEKTQHGKKKKKKTDHKGNMADEDRDLIIPKRTRSRTDPSEAGLLRDRAILPQGVTLQPEHAASIHPSIHHRHVEVRATILGNALSQPSPTAGSRTGAWLPPPPLCRRAHSSPFQGHGASLVKLAVGCTPMRHKAWSWPVALQAISRIIFESFFLPSQMVPMLQEDVSVSMDVRVRAAQSQEITHWPAADSITGEGGCRRKGLSHP